MTTTVHYADVSVQGKGKVEIILIYFSGRVQLCRIKKGLMNRTQTHPNSLANLIPPIAPGEARNPRGINGRGPNPANLMQRLLAVSDPEHGTCLARLFKRQLSKADDGDLDALKFCVDVAYGPKSGGAQAGVILVLNRELDRVKHLSGTAQVVDSVVVSTDTVTG